jgi:hypothetical protein
MLTSAFQPTAASGDIRGAAHGGFPVGMRPHRPGPYFLGNVEPTLDEVMDDPMVRRLMDRDGVAVDSLLGLIDEVRDRLR